MESRSYRAILLSALLLLFTYHAVFSQLIVTESVTQPSCYLYDDAGISLNISGGTAPYFVTWYNNGQPIAYSQDLNGITDGTYRYIISDNTGITITDTVLVAASYRISTIDTIYDAKCYGINGSLNINPFGGIEHYLGIWQRFLWDSWSQTWEIDTVWADTAYTKLDTVWFRTSLPAGRYRITITDNYGTGCSVQQEYEIKEPSSPVEIHEQHSNNICKYGSAAFININADGGTAPYTILWSDGAASPSRTQLATGIYTLTVTDSQGCGKAESIDITEPFQDLILHKEIQDVSCRDNSDGYISVEAIENGTPPYLYEWSDGTTDNGIEELLAGTYVITVTDNNNCVHADTVMLGVNDIDCITINNVITPDGNGKNDTWIIENIDLYPECEVFVYDRWGKLVYSSTAYDNSWNGTCEGKDLNNTEFYYVVTLNSGSYPTYTGPIKLIK